MAQSVTPLKLDRHPPWAMRKAYADVALNPTRGFHFHTGRPLAQLLGYPQAWVDAGRACPRMVLLSIVETRGNVPLQVVEAVPWGIQ